MVTISDNGKDNLEKYKIVLFENMDVGRSLMRWYIEDVKKSDFNMSIGVDFTTKNIEYAPEQKASVQFWRLAGQQMFRMVRSSFYKGASGSIIFYSLTEPKQGFEYFSNRYYEIKEFGGNIPILVFAVDLEKVEGREKSEFDNKIRKIVESDGNLYMYSRSDTIEEIDNGIKRLIKLMVKLKEKEKFEELTQEEISVIKEFEKIIGQEIPKLQINIDDVFGYKIENNHAIELYLRNFNIMELPENIGNLKYLKILDLESNKLSSLNSSIKELKSLALINLSKNNFTSIPTELWALEKLKLIELKNNPWKGESKEYYDKSAEIIREFCRKRANIHIFISHAVSDFSEYKIKNLSIYLGNQDEIYKAYYCEDDLKGNIDEFMDHTIPQCQLLLFFATRNSVFHSIDCKHELELAKIHKLQIIPIKGKDIEWSDLENIGLGRELGLEFDGNNFNNFCEVLYKYIYEFKRKIDLNNKEKGRIDKIILNIANIINEYLKSEKGSAEIEKNKDMIESLLEKYSKEKITFRKFTRKLTRIV